MVIPFVNLERQYESIKSEITEGLNNSLHAFNFRGGSEIRSFEQSFSSMLGCNHCIGVGNGTDALFLALRAARISSGDEVITPAFSWISSSEVITMCGAKPVFADVDTSTFTIDPRDIERKITPGTRAVIVVHLYGQSAEMKPILDICKKHDLVLIEDCAQAHLTSYQGKYVGSFGHLGGFSFYPTKNLGAYGEAGCVVTQDADLNVMVRRMANHGALQKEDHAMEGCNSRMDSIQAAVLCAKLPYLKAWNEKRNLNARLYDTLLRDIGDVTTPVVRADTKHSFHLYVIKTRQRDGLKEFLKRKGIETIVHYPRALHNLEAYRYLKHRPDDFPVANRLQNEVLSLPIYPELRENEITYIADRVKEFYSAN